MEKFASSYGVIFCQLHRQPDRCDHAFRVRDSLARNFESGSVIRTGAREWQAKRDVHPFVKSVQFQRDQSLVVIHTKDRPEFSFDRAVEYRIRREWAEEKFTVTIQLGDCRPDNLELFPAELAALAGVRIQTRHRDP